MIIGIDATNIKAGGGLTHLNEILNHLNPKKHKIEKIIIWGGENLDKITDRVWIEKRKAELAKNWLIYLFYWRFFTLSKEVRQECQILFNPGGGGVYRKLRYVSMSQNMLPFEKIERERFPIMQQFRYLILLYIQKISFSRASGMIFISNYAANFIRSKYKSIEEVPFTVVYHGVTSRFRYKPRVQLPIKDYNYKRPYKILYVSILNYYKHQEKLIEAIKMLRAKGYPIELTLLGSANPTFLNVLKNNLKKCQEFVKYVGFQKYSKMEQYYQETDLFVFASTCENMPNILVEAMSSGLPILSSNYGPMPEILADAGTYCDPTSPSAIAYKLEELINSASVRKELSIKAFKNANTFSWKNCADETFKFIKEL